MPKSCEKHPKYDGTKEPNNECSDCLSYYLALHERPRFPIRPTKVIKDRSKYNRKDKKWKKKDI